jgi:hypothetical protein
MAIIIEEEKNRSNLGSLIGWFIILVIIASSIYYVFFAAPELVIITASDNLSAIAPIAQAPLQANDILQNPAFRALVSPTIPLVPTSTTSGGRPNPFIAP